MKPPTVADAASLQGRSALTPVRGAQGLAALFFFLLLGDLAWSLKERSVQELAKAQLYILSDNALVLNALFGALPALIVMGAGPLIGAWSDRTRSRFGRRIPFLFASAPLVLISMVALAYSNDLAAMVGKAIAAPQSAQPSLRIMSMTLCWMFFEIFTTIANALFIALINDTVPRKIIGRFFGMFRIVSLGAGALFFYFVFGKAMPDALRPLLLIIGAIYFLGFLLLCRGVNEPAYPAPASMPAHPFRVHADSEAPSLYPLLYIALAIATISVLPININSFNAKAQFGVSQHAFGEAIALTYMISIALALPLGWLADRFHPVSIGFVVLVAYAASMLAAWFLIDGRTSFLFWFVVHGVLAGCFLTGTASLLPMLLPGGRFSEMAAFSASVTSLLAVVATLGLGLLLDYSGRNFRLMFLAGGVAAALAALAWFLLIRELWRRDRAAGRRPSP